MIFASSTFQWLGDKVLGAVLGDIDRRMVDAGNRGLAVMQAMAPRRTGFLASQESFAVVDHTLVFRFGAPYDVFQEFGTRYIRPHPHIRPGLRAIGHTLGFDIELQFNRPGGPQWHGIFATGGMTVVPRGLSGHRLAHVRQHLATTNKRLHRGNVKKAKMVVRRFD